MAKKKEIDKVKLSAFPEEVDKDGLKWYGEMSYETQMAAINRHWDFINEQITRAFKGEKTIAIDIAK